MISSNTIVSYNLLNAMELPKGPFKFKLVLVEYQESYTHVQDAPPDIGLRNLRLSREILKKLIGADYALEMSLLITSTIVSCWRLNLVY